MLDQTAVAPMAAAISRKARRLMMGIGGYLTQGDVHRLDGANLIQKAAQHLFEAARVFQKEHVRPQRPPGGDSEIPGTMVRCVLGEQRSRLWPRPGEPGREHGPGVTPNFLRFIKASPGLLEGGSNFGTLNE